MATISSLSNLWLDFQAKLGFSTYLFLGHGSLVGVAFNQNFQQIFLIKNIKSHKTTVSIYYDI